MADLIAFDAAQLAQLDATIQALAEGTSDLMDVWPAVGRVFRDRQQHLFATSGDGTWQPLASETLRRKRHIGAPLKPMIRTGSLLAESSDPTPVAAGPGFAAFGIDDTGIKYWARFHQRGTGRLPQRQVVPPLTAAERRDITRRIGEEIMKNAKAS